MKNYYGIHQNGFADIVDYNNHFQTIHLDESFEKGGFPLHSKNGVMLVSTNDSHALIDGTTGSKKTRCFMYNTVLNLALSEEKPSMFIADAKGDLPIVLKGFLEKQGYHVIWLNLRDPDESNGYNPISFAWDLAKSDKAQEARNKLHDLLEQFFMSTLSEDDNYWVTTTTPYTVTLAECLIILGEDKSDVTFENIANLHEKLRSSSIRRAFVKKLRDMDRPDLAASIEAIFDNAGDTSKNLISMIDNDLRLMSRIRFINQPNDFEISQIVDYPTVVFVTPPDERNDLNFFVSTMIHQFYSELVSVASKTNNVLNRRVYFLIDEFGNLPEVKDFSAKISASRSRNIRFCLIVQTLSQISSVYNSEQTKNIFNNCENVIVFRTQDEELAKILSAGFDKMTLEHTGETVDLIRPSILRSLDKTRGEAIVSVMGINAPLRTTYADYMELDISLPKSEYHFSKPNDNPVRFDIIFDSFMKSGDDASKEEDYRYASFRDREEFIVEIEKPHEKAFLITNCIKYIKKSPNDVLIVKVFFGFERKIADYLIELTDNKQLVLDAVYGCVHGRDEFLIRFPNAGEKKSALQKLDSLCEWEDPTGNRPHSENHFDF